MINRIFKNVCVTGAGSGIGRAIAIAMSNEGYNVTCADINLKQANETLEIILNCNGSGISIETDVTKINDIENMILQTVKQFGTIDILVNNAGIIKRTPLADMAVEDFKEVINVDLISPFIVSKSVIKGMIDRKSGKIINICSMMSELGRNTVGAYAAAKGGLKMLTKNMCVEWARHNIQVNGIGPGYFATEQTKPIRVNGNPFNEFIVNRTPTGIWGEPDQLQGAAVFLSSKASDFVNGQIIYVDGGILATIGKPNNEI